MSVLGETSFFEDRPSGPIPNDTGGYLVFISLSLLRGDSRTMLHRLFLRRAVLGQQVWCMCTRPLLLQRGRRRRRQLIFVNRDYPRGLRSLGGNPLFFWNRPSGSINPERGLQCQTNFHPAFVQCASGIGATAPSPSTMKWGNSPQSHGSARAVHG